MRVEYDRIVQSVAMSKWPKQKGLELTYIKDDLYYNPSKEVIKIQAINPKMNDITSYLSMEIPVESIDSVIEVLKALKNQINEEKDKS